MALEELSILERMAVYIWLDTLKSAWHSIVASPPFINCLSFFPYRRHDFPTRKLKQYRKEEEVYCYSLETQSHFIPSITFLWLSSHMSESLKAIVTGRDMKIITSSEHVEHGCVCENSCVIYRKKHDKILGITCSVYFVHVIH